MQKKRLSYCTFEYICAYQIPIKLLPSEIATVPWRTFTPTFARTTSIKTTCKNFSCQASEFGMESARRQLKDTTKTDRAHPIRVQTLERKKNNLHLTYSDISNNHACTPIYFFLRISSTSEPSKVRDTKW